MKKLTLLLLFAGIFFSPLYSNSILNLNVKGMHCGGCEVKFKSAAAEVNGIKEVTSISAANGNAVISFDEKVITAEKVVQELASKSGFGISATTVDGISTSEGKPAGCCMKGQHNPSCKKEDKAKCTKKCEKAP